MKGQKTGGRKKGSINKTTALAKEAIATAAEMLGGVERLVAWAQEDAQNERVFWGSMYPKLLPLQLTGDANNPIELVQRIERVIVGGEEQGQDASDRDAARIPTAH